ncbi:LytTR family DNA-binding domain-containing protein [Bifidobacterium sp. UBA4282]|uniref:LytR/AlgR family response regulator transcription factor n=1 Tax=Bifidobacterium sp. UBA4282 TaxID=1946096 RepID=UPI0025BF13C2|nr:LytTR family DNA-binding domain-containing protein [Bifidobacterium sp. UBA4282]
MIRIAIVEDETTYADTLREYLDRYAAETGCLFAVSVYADGEDIVQGYRADFDIILMDIEMRSMDGMTAAKRIRESDDDVVIMFITNMAQYAIQGYEVDALDYVLKPISYFAFSKRLERAISRVAARSRAGRSIVISSRGSSSRIPVDSILWIESHGHRLTYHTTNGEYESTVNSMKAVEESLAGDHFFRCNKCYLVNLAHVRGIADGDALVGSDRIVVSQSKRGAFVKALTEYAGETVS